MEKRYLLTMTDIAELMGVSLRTVKRRRTDDPTFPAVVPSNGGVKHHPRWSREDMMRWLDANPGQKKTNR